LHASQTARRTAVTWLAALMGSLALLLAMPALSHAEDNANNYACLGHIKAGQPEAGNEEQQVQYGFYCDGPITGYQLQSQVPVTGIRRRRCEAQHDGRGPHRHVLVLGRIPRLTR